MKIIIRIYKNVVILFSVIGVIIAIYYILQFIQTKPRVTYSSNSYFIFITAIIYNFSIENNGRKPAKDIGLSIILQDTYKIDNVMSTPPFTKVNGGRGKNYIILNWDEIPPKSSIHGTIVYTGSIEDPQSAYPFEEKVWYKDKLVHFQINTYQ